MSSGGGYNVHPADHEDRKTNNFFLQIKQINLPRWREMGTGPETQAIHMRECSNNFLITLIRAGILCIYPTAIILV